MMIKHSIFYFQEDSAWAFPKQSPYLDLFNEKLFKLKQSGILQKLLKSQVRHFLQMSKMTRIDHQLVILIIIFNFISNIIMPCISNF